MVEVSASLLNVEKEKCLSTIYQLEVAHTDYFHIDVMDGEFVENNTVEKMLQYTGYLKQVSTLPIEVHLMVKDVKKYIDLFLPFEPHCITFHVEAVEKKEERMKLIDYLKKNHCKAGLSVKPNTKVEALKEYLPFLHQVLIMTVEPGKGGQEFLPSTIEKISEVKEFIQKQNLDVMVQVDGGINLNTADKVKTAGADNLVVGSALIKAKDDTKMIQQLKEEKE